MIDALWTLAVFAPLLGLYGLVLWLTGTGGPCDVMQFWDEEQDRR